MKKNASTLASQHPRLLGLDGSRAFLKYRTGIEEYSYQVLKHLRAALPTDVRVRVYVRKKIRFQKGKFETYCPEVDFSLPENWELVGLWAPRFWTQIRLSLEMFFHPVEALLVPAHTVPVIHAGNTVVVVHGLEYEMSPKSYSWWERLYMRASIKYSVQAASKVIAVSQNTKADLEQFYQVPSEKIQVVYEGYESGSSQQAAGSSQPEEQSHILFVGRIEERKNVKRIVEAFEILKAKYRVSHELILVGKPGFGYEAIKFKIQSSKFKSDIEELGYVSAEEKQRLLAEACVFIFPSLYEGFGLPILEAQAAGTPVVTSNTSSLPEVAGDGAIYVNPENPEDIAEKLHQVLTMPAMEYQSLVAKGYQNVERFSWEKCAEEIRGQFM